MTLRFTRLVLGLEILLIQLLGVALFLLYAPSIGYAFDKALVGAVTIAPITGAHVALFVKYISLRVTPEDEAENQQIRAGNFYVKLIIISAFGAFVLSGIYFLIHDSNQTEEAAQLFSGAMQTIFGGYLATIFGALFPKELFSKE